ncbi:MAG: hypothetical protein Ct9H300mP12_13430 [Acidimicrobiales bacterium]|nr:MAG: hypothetical protein Ct9H300mP12_13430 [Acidimicrobiales bacterium]
MDADATLCDEDGNVLVDGKWGIYYKPDFNFGGVQGGFMPYPVEKPWRDVAMTPPARPAPTSWSGGLPGRLGRAFALPGRSREGQTR